MTTTGATGVELLWLPLGAGGHLVRLNGRVYEFVQAKRAHREPLDLYHTALEVDVSEGHFVIENAWPIPDNDPTKRGVTVQGPVWSHWLGHFRIFRYEVRRWRGGSIADIAEAVGGLQRLTGDKAKARAVFEAAKSVPAHVWGRDVLQIGEMWNSNSPISRILTIAGIDASTIPPPAGGSAPGWRTGVVAAKHQSSE